MKLNLFLSIIEIGRLKEFETGLKDYWRRLLSSSDSLVVSFPDLSSGRGW